MSEKKGAQCQGPRRHFSGHRSIQPPEADDGQIAEFQRSPARPLHTRRKRPRKLDFIPRWLKRHIVACHPAKAW